MELLSGHEKKITPKSGISLNAGTLNRGFTVFVKNFLLVDDVFTILMNFWVITDMSAALKAYK
jgi:hypothetical protein